MHFYSRLIFRRMSRLLCLVLCPALCLMPAACSPAAENSSGPAASSASSGTASETESDGGSGTSHATASGVSQDAASGTDADGDTGLVLFAGGAYTGTMVYARGDAAALSAAYTLKQTLEAVTGVTFSSRDRMREEGAETDTAGCEILIGNIERGQDSASLPLRGYRIEATGNKLLCRVASAEDIGEAAARLCDALPGFYQNGVLRIPDGWSLSGDFLPDPESLRIELTPGKSYTARIETLFTFPVCGDRGQYRIVQGGTFDGTYYYVALIDNQSDPMQEWVCLCKFDKSGRLLAKREGLALDHANNITYVPKWNRLLVSHCQSTEQNPEKHWNRCSLVDPDTLTVTDTADLPLPFFSMAYCEELDRFCSGEWAGGTLDTWDGELNHLQSYSVTPPKGTSQGAEADGHYLYFPRYNPNSLQVYSWDGEHCFDIPIVSKNGEVEHVSVADGIFYIGGNNATWTGGYFGYLVIEELT